MPLLKPEDYETERRKRELEIYYMIKHFFARYNEKPKKSKL